METTTGAPAALPASAFATRISRTSSTPAHGTPMRRSPRRPMSWIDA